MEESSQKYEIVSVQEVHCECYSISIKTQLITIELPSQLNFIFHTCQSLFICTLEAMAPRKRKSTTGLNRLNLCDECNECIEKCRSEKTPRRRPQRRRSQRRRRQRKSNGKLFVPNQNLYSRNIYTLLKCIYPDLSISRMAMNVMNSFFMDLLDRIATEASTLMYLSKRVTMDYNDITSATKLVIKSTELSGLAIDAASAIVDWSENH